ncbi:P-II family nitrogen regulator [Thermococcus sp.]|uniref:P-II family nitrogen regulator n=1 Tax=Thermococcus sp. TaxID=35749 RepID=UPI003429E000
MIRPLPFKPNLCPEAFQIRLNSYHDGKIFVIPVEDAVRIKTGEGGNGALVLGPSQRNAWRCL